MALVTAQEWATYTDAPPPANLEGALEAASGAVTGHCEWSIARQVLTQEVLDGPGGWLLQLPTLLLLSVEQVLLDDVEVTDFRVSPAGMLERRGAGWPLGFGRVKASYTHGHDPVPADIKALVVSVVLGAMEARPGVKSESIGRMRTEWFERSLAGLGALDRLALQKYVL